MHCPTDNNRSLFSFALSIICIDRYVIVRNLLFEIGFIIGYKKQTEEKIVQT